MEMTFLGYLFISSTALCLFWVVYRLWLSKLTFFHYQRVYILLAVVASLYLPYLSTSSFLGNIFVETNTTTVSEIYPTWMTTLFSSNQHLGDVYNNQAINSYPMGKSEQEVNGNAFYMLNYEVLLLTVLGFIYCIGCLIQLIRYFRKLFYIQKLIQVNEKVKEGKYWLVHLPTQSTFSSFFRFIFLNDSIHHLTPTEVFQIKQHEQIHSQQWHSLDILIMEFFKVIFWFHPLVYSLSNYLKDVHEYVVDAVMINNRADKKVYAQLLLKLSANRSFNSLTTDFTSKQTGRRIAMLAATPSSALHKFRFLLMIPLFTSLLLFSAFFIDEPQLPKFDFTTVISEPQSRNFYEHNKFVIDKINWQGSELFTDEELSFALSIKEGEVIPSSMLNRRFNEVKQRTIYLSQLYYTERLALGEVRVELVEFQKEKLTVTIRITEKNEFYLKLGKITWEGNTVYSEEELNTALQLKQGDDYSKEILNQRLRFDENGNDVSGLYLNEGYAYFNIQEEEVRNGNIVDLVFKIFEGPIVKIGNVKISGNTKIPTSELISKIQIKVGDKFSRDKIIAAQKMFFEMKEFDPMKIGIATPILEDNNQLMNIEFILVEVEK